MKLIALTPEQVRETIEARNDGEPLLIDRVAKELGMSRRQLFYYQRDGVVLDVPDAAATLLEAAGIKIVAGKKSRR